MATIVTAALKHGKPNLRVWVAQNLMDREAYDE